MKRLPFWPVFLVTLLAVNVCIVLVTVYLANSDASYSVEPAYYQKAVHWEERQRQIQLNSDLGWTAKCDMQQPAVLRMHLADRAGQPISDARIEGVAFHNAYSSEQATLRWSNPGGGDYTSPLEITHAGLWTIQLVVRRGETRFTADLEQSFGVPVRAR